MQFITASGSAYEVDEETRRVRRLSGSLAPTERQGPDGVWKEYASISEVVPGLPVMILWKTEDETFIPCTQTSMVETVF